MKNLDENIGALSVKLTEEELREISDAIPINEVAGGRTYELFNNVSWRFANTPTLK